MPRSEKALAHDAARREVYARMALKALHGYFSEYAALPSYSELTERMGLAARSWTYVCVQRLIDSNHVAKLPSGRLAPGEKFFDEL